MRLFSGQRAFVLQRLTALAMLAFLAAVALRLVFGTHITYATWNAWSARPFGATVLLFVSTAVFLHAWVGIRDVLLDYVHPFALRLTALALVAVGLAGLAGWTFIIIVTHAISHISI